MAVVLREIITHYSKRALYALVACILILLVGEWVKNSLSVVICRNFR
jgi:hypothetical protein